MKDIREYLTDSSKINAVITSGAILKNKILLKSFFEMAYSEEEKYSVRASYVICHLSKVKSDLIEPHTKQIILKLSELNNSGVKKNFLKIFESYILIKEDELLGILIDVCYSFLLKPSESLATRIYSMQIIFNAAKEIPELKTELKLVLEEILIEEIPSLSQRAKRLLKSL